ncbi:N,N-dimethylformamidase beta subunit family domain-containing protein [Actinomadura syzygii]|uniref:N,N-dimethylformamidase beta subunit family domain-containing protein n=1 Tax=Actinomadura syzygii TaxID=1427538 RepID=UPI001CA30423|nr:N,N-dimethylformamidase beta subunit family domain-containing protein [Actinomadura syzygii]
MESRARGGIGPGGRPVADRGLRCRALLVLVLALFLAAACSSGTHDRDPGGQGALKTAAVAENAKHGDADWRIARRSKGAEHEIEGYADHVSVLPGGRFRLFVSTTTPGFSVQAFRMGWYGGAQARRVWRSGTYPGVRQGSARIDRASRTVSAPWRPSLTVSTEGWPEGSYLMMLTAASGAQRYVPVTVRSPNTAGRLVVLNGTTTWQAYNMWGGYDLYKGPSGGENDRASAVSFDRPYDGNGAGKFMQYEQPAIALAEKLGVPLAYATDNDLHSDPGLLKGARGLLSLGHDEYWSSAMRQRATRARDQGVNIAFLGANAVNRHIRFGATPLGANRLVVCYKDSGTDPVARTDPAESTQDWRLPPMPRPESDLIGIQYMCFPAEGAFTVSRPDFWLFRGTGVRAGTRFPGVIGPEADALNRGGPTPGTLEIVASSPITCGNRSAVAHASYYTNRQGAGVFATGTMRWVCAMRGPACGHGITEAGRRFVTQVSEMLVRAMAEGPLGRAHPSRPNYKLTASGR